MGRAIRQSLTIIGLAGVAKELHMFVRSGSRAHGIGKIVTVPVTAKINNKAQQIVIAGEGSFGVFLGNHFITPREEVAIINLLLC